MHPRELLAHKLAEKRLREIPPFKPLKRGKLPRPFHRSGGGRVESTGLVDVSPTHVVHFLARDGQTLQDASFYGYLLVRLANGSLSPLFEFHWHPSHKGFHCKTACRATESYTDRLLVRAAELNLKTVSSLDPRKPDHRAMLVHVVCEACGIAVGHESPQGTLWK